MYALIVPFERSIAANPRLAREYSAENSLPPDQVFASTGKKLKWDCHICGHKWEAKGLNRNINKRKGNNCPACANRVATPFNNLAAARPDIIFEYSSKNPKPMHEMLAGTHTLLIWECSVCGWEWVAAGKSRTRGTNCPACAGKAVSDKNNLTATHPELAREYSERNIKPADKVIAGTHQKLWWRCPFCRWEWLAAGASRLRGSKCPSCSKRIVTPNNNLAFVYPDLAEEFLEKENGCSARHVIAGGYSKKYWWRCRYCKKRWQTSVYNRINGSLCPFCGRRKNSY